jgi:alpha-beta hydrolase superfamily lysophospholipase
MSIGRHHPFWITAGGRNLYAALHPAGPPQHATGVVCVPPLLHEQPRSRRFVTETASALAALGLPCLRFDFHGTGDSPGAGNELDFGSMRADLDAAVAALKTHAGVDRVVLLAWRGAALPVAAWLDAGARADLVVLWEPIVDGMGWLAELERQDAGERAGRPRPRPGVPRTADPDDGQLMGFAASAKLRRELGDARIEGRIAHDIPVWTVVREATALPVEIARTWTLPAGTPTFAGGASMEATLFLSPALERVVDELGRALLERERVEA